MLVTVDVYGDQHASHAIVVGARHCREERRVESAQPVAEVMAMLQGQRVPGRV